MGTVFQRVRMSLQYPATFIHPAARKETSSHLLLIKETRTSSLALLVPITPFIPSCTILLRMRYANQVFPNSRLSLSIPLTTACFYLLCKWTHCSGCGEITYILSSALTILHSAFFYYVGGKLDG